MSNPGNPFKDAERFLQLRKVCAPMTWGATIGRINEMILTPLITLFFVFLGDSSVWSVIPAALSTFRAWKDWIEYQRLRFVVQGMFLHTMRVGGPFIVTNDSTYMPYVFADAVYRVPVGIANAPPTGTLDA